MIYNIFKVLLNITVRLYFKRKHVTNQHLIPKDKPVLFVANHQSAFMDPIVLSIYSRRSMYFLARGESFKNKVGAWFFSKLHMIPIYRKEETPELAHKNDEVFSKCYNHFQNDGALLIFPEGSSKTEPRLRKIKTGAARIALGAEAEFNFTLGLTIIPVGINYSNPHMFRSGLHVNFGEPISLSDFENDFKSDSFSASKKLTKLIEERIEERVLIVDKEEDEKLVSQVEEVYYGELLNKLGVKSNEQERGIELKKDLVTVIEYFQKEAPDFTIKMKDKLDCYFSLIKTFNGAEDLFHKRLKRNQKLPVWFYAFSLVLGFPLFAIGWVLHYAQYRLIGKLTVVLTAREDFMGSMRMLLGMLVYLITYIIYIRVSWSVLSFEFWLAFILGMPLSGLFTLWYSRIYYLNKTELYFRRLLLTNNMALKQLHYLRVEIVNEFESARKKYNEIHDIVSEKLD
jgi:1-acyl-sn-glycerol-3-phosphate acyltransferase